MKRFKETCDRGVSPSTVESIPPGPDSDGAPSHPKVPNPHGPVVTPPHASYQVSQQAISVPSPSVPGEPSTVLPPRVVQLVCPCATLTMPPSSGHTVPASVTHARGIEVLRNRLESGVQAMAAQDFQQCPQWEKEGVSDFICQ